MSNKITFCLSQLSYNSSRIDPLVGFGHKGTIILTLINKKSPAHRRGMGAGQMSLPHEGIIDRGLCKYVTEFSTISTDHCNQTGGVFFALKCLLNTAINKKPNFFLEVVTFKKFEESASFWLIDGLAISFSYDNPCYQG
jgi:hypothetical protein